MTQTWVLLLFALIQRFFNTIRNGLLSFCNEESIAAGSFFSREFFFSTRLCPDARTQVKIFVKTRKREKKR